MKTSTSGTNACKVFGKRIKKRLKMYTGGNLMSYLEAVKSGFSNYVKFNGRASRSEFWWFYLFVVIVSFLVNVIIGLTGLPTLISLLVWLGLLLPLLGLYFRRLHDADHTAWWLLISLIPVVGFIVLIVFLATPGSAGDNRFGAPVATSVN